MKRRISLIALMLGIALVVATMMSHQNVQQSTLDELHKRINNSDSFIVQIGLENCPACDQLVEKEAQGQWFTQSSPVIVTIRESQKDAVREQLKQLIPSFLYYPSIFYFENGEVKSEFDLSTLDGVEKRYLEWLESIQ